MDNIKITFPDDFEIYNGEYILSDLDSSRLNFKVIKSYEHGYSLLIDEDQKKYMLINPKTNEILFYEKLEDLETEFFLKEYKNYRLKEKFLIQKLKNYKPVEIKIERFIKSLFTTVYESMDFEKKMEYMRSSSNRNIDGIKGIYQLENVKIKLSSKFDDIGEILDCDCTVVTSDGGCLKYSWGTDQDSNVGYLFTFDCGYIEVIYERYYYDSDLGSLFLPISSKIVIGDEKPIDGFFKDISDRNWITDNFIDQTGIYNLLFDSSEKNVKIEFIIGLQKPERIKERYEYEYGYDYNEY